MMSLLAQIKNDQVAARKAKNKVLADTLTTLYSEAANEGLNKGKRESTDAEVIAVLKKFINNCVSTISVVGDGEVKEGKKEEIKVYEAYLPKQLSTEEMHDIITGMGVVSLPQIMNHFKTNYAGLYDGKALATLAKTL